MSAATVLWQSNRTAASVRSLRGGIAGCKSDDSNGPTEGLNLLVKEVKRAGRFS